MNLQAPSSTSLGWRKSILLLVVAVVCFQGAYASVKIPIAGFLIVGYAFCLIGLTDQSSVRRAFYFGLVTGFLCAAPQLFFFWTVFGPAAIVLWVIFGFWIGLFMAIVCGSIRRWGKTKAMWLVPIIWTGVEYFRSELNYLKFSWLNIGYALPISPHFLGMYGLGFVVFVIIVGIFYVGHFKNIGINPIAVILITFVVAYAISKIPMGGMARYGNSALSIAGIQMEFPPAGILGDALNAALKKNTNAPIFVLSEYTLDGPPPEILKNWCRKNSRYVIVGGKDYVTNHIYYNTAFVLDTNGEVVFKQAKSVPIQFFDDGLPAKTQQVWDSPFGKIGICICYDLSYTRVTDELVREGAQLLVVPTMDVSEWGRHQHELHSRVAPVRAAEYGIPIFRLASSGISQAVDGYGNVLGKTRFGMPGDMLSATFQLPFRGSLPWDRYLAPVCTGVTGLVLAMLLWLTWKERGKAR